LRNKIKGSKSLTNQQNKDFIIILGNIIRKLVGSPAEFRRLTESTFKEWYNSEISEIEFSESAVGFDVDGNLIIPNIDSNVIAEEIETHISEPTEIQMKNMALEVMQDLDIFLMDDEPCE
jgi:hypothetical protein